MKRLPPKDAGTTNLRYRSGLFVIRLWQENSDGEACWHGLLEHSASGRSRDFDDWDTFVAALNEFSEDHQLASTAGHSQWAFK